MMLNYKLRNLMLFPKASTSDHMLFVLQNVINIEEITVCYLFRDFDADVYVNPRMRVIYYYLSTFGRNQVPDDETSASRKTRITRKCIKQLVATRIK